VPHQIVKGGTERFYSVKNGVKDYNMLKNSMNDLVAKEVGFNKGFF
jgi:hypothetical protein